MLSHFYVVVVTVSILVAVVMILIIDLFLSSGSSEEKSSPAAVRSQQTDLVERSPKERPSPQASPAGRSASSSSDSGSSSSNDDEDEHHSALRKIRSSVAQIRVRTVSGTSCVLKHWIMPPSRVGLSYVDDEKLRWAE